MKRRIKYALIFLSLHFVQFVDILRAARMWAKLETWMDSASSGPLGNKIKDSLRAGMPFNQTPFLAGVRDPKVFDAFHAVYAFYGGQIPMDTSDIVREALNVRYPDGGFLGIMGGVSESGHIHILTVLYLKDICHFAMYSYYFAFFPTFVPVRCLRDVFEFIFAVPEAVHWGECVWLCLYSTRAKSHLNELGN